MPTHVIQKQVGDFQVVGYSLAGEETTVAIPELDVVFDVGRAPREIVPINNLCLSHGHMDHAAGLAYYLSQRIFIGTAPGRVISHADLSPHLEALMECWSRIEGHRSPGEFVGIRPGETFELRRNLLLRAFAVNHSQYAIGFAVVEVRHKLKPEYVGLTGPQLVALKKQGTEIENKLEVPLVAYCGDCADGPCYDLDDVRNARMVIMECTFFDPDHMHRARVGQHTHVRDLPGILPRLRTPNILLTHFTRRTDMRTARRALQAVLDPIDHERITILMERPPREGNRKPNRPNAR